MSKCLPNWRPGVGKIMKFYPSVWGFCFKKDRMSTFKEIMTVDAKKENYVQIEESDSIRRELKEWDLLF